MCNPVTRTAWFITGDLGDDGPSIATRWADVGEFISDDRGSGKRFDKTGAGRVGELLRLRYTVVLPWIHETWWCCDTTEISKGKRFLFCTS